MFKRFLKILLYLILVPVFVQAQFGGVETLSTSDVGIVSYIDNTVNPACAGTSILPNNLTSCLPHIEVIDISQYNTCTSNGTLAECNTDFEYLVPYITEKQVDDTLFDITKAYQTYRTEVIAIYNSELNKLPNCLDLLAVCPKVFDPVCIADRQQKAYLRVVSEAQPKYWTKVYESIYRHAPAALSYSNPYPTGTGMIFSPVTANNPRVNQYYSKLVAPHANDAVEFARRAGWIAELDIPYLPDEISIDAGGISDFEADKRSLQRSTILEQERYGFASLFGIYNNTELGYHFDVLTGPYVPGFCWACTTPLCVPMIPTPSIIPLPAIIYPEPRARPRNVAIPEGEAIPHINGNPIPNPLN